MAASDFKKGSTGLTRGSVTLTGAKGQEPLSMASVSPLNNKDSDGESITEGTTPVITTADDMAGGEYTDARIKEYYEYLKTKDITDGDIVSVLDTLITSGSVKWGFKLFNRIEVDLVVRPAWVNSFILREVETLAPKTFSRFTDIVSTYNLAGSLVKFGSQKFSNATEADVRNNYDDIARMSFIVQNKLVQQLAIFDRLIAVATSDWAIENFTKPQSEN